VEWKDNALTIQRGEKRYQIYFDEKNYTITATMWADGKEKSWTISSDRSCR